MAGRRSTPNDFRVGDAISQESVLNRTIRAQVRTVDADNGFVTLIYENMPGGGKFTTIQPLWMSFPDAKIGNPAWGRFIPQESDLVRISFDYDDRPVIVGHDISAQKAGVADGLTGWPAINEEYKKAKDKGANGPADKAKFAQFVPIKPGEYDFMSSGGAYIYGNNRGRLYLAGGNVSITLIKNDLRISQRSQLLSHTAESSELRFGQVRRNDTSSQLDKKVSSDSNGAFREFSVVLRKTIDEKTSQDLSTFKIGNVVADNGDVIGPDNPYRFLYQSFDTTGAESLKMSVDTLGNWDVTGNDKATTGAVLDFQYGDWQTRFKTVTHSNSVKTSIDSPDVNLGAVDAPEALILGNTYGNAEKDYVDDMASQVKDLATSVQTLATAIVAFCTSVVAVAPTAITVSPGAPIASVVAIGVGAATLLTSAQSEISKALSVATQATIVASTFSQPYDTYLSTVVKTK